MPRKNIKHIGGRPLIEYAIQAAQDSALMTDYVVSTDDEQIADVARNAGAPVPFLRPAEFATDSAGALPVILHALEKMEELENCQFDIVVMLQPPTPMRRGSDIDEALNILIKTKADSVVSVVDVGADHPLRMKRIIGDGLLVNYIDQGTEDMRPRQELPSVYIRNGAIYASYRHIFTEQNTLVGDDCRALVMPPERSVNIDDAFDVIRAEHLLNNEMTKS